MPRLPFVPTLAAFACVGLIGPSSASGQLRPLDPLDWRVFGEEGGSVEVGGGAYWSQRASLAGTEGLLVEVGAVRATWGLGRVALQLAGSALWVYDDRTVFADPLPGVEPADGRRRIDAGDYRVSTLVRLTAPGSRVAAALRFGARLPTTDNVKGLERDRTDFFSLLAGRVLHGGWDVGGELGLGIHGTRETANEQVDPILFGLSVVRDFGLLKGLLELAGHHDPRAGEDRRGTEDLGEARAGVRLGERRWISLYAVRGWTIASPEFGLTVRMGARF